MFHLLSCFNLKAGSASINSTAPGGRRQMNTITDTDDERDHQCFVTLSFWPGCSAIARWTTSVDTSNRATGFIGKGT